MYLQAKIDWIKTIDQTWVHIPELEVTVERSADDPGGIELEAGDGVLVTGQRHDACTLVVPYLQHGQMVQWKTC